MPGFINDYKCLECKHCFKRSPLFNVLTEEELDLLNEKRMEVNFRKGEIIFKQGTPLTHLVIIHTGLGKIYIEGNDGRNLMLTYTKNYDLNGGVGVFMDHRHYSSLIAVTDCGACFIEIKAFKEVLKQNHVFMENYLRDFSARMLHTYNQFTVLTQKNMEGRMAETILYLKNQIFMDGTINNVSKQDLAELTAMTRESAIRVLKEFKEEGLIDIDNQTIHILNPKALEMIALHG